MCNGILYYYIIIIIKGRKRSRNATIYIYIYSITATNISVYLSKLIRKIMPIKELNYNHTSNFTDPRSSFCFTSLYTSGSARKSMLYKMKTQIGGKQDLINPYRILYKNQQT